MVTEDSRLVGGIDSANEVEIVVAFPEEDCESSLSSSMPEPTLYFNFTELKTWNKSWFLKRNWSGRAKWEMSGCSNSEIGKKVGVGFVPFLKTPGLE